MILKNTSKLTLGYNASFKSNGFWHFLVVASCEKLLTVLDTKCSLHQMMINALYNSTFSFFVAFCTLNVLLFLVSLIGCFQLQATAQKLRG